MQTILSENRLLHDEVDYEWLFFKNKQRDTWITKWASIDMIGNGIKGNHSLVIWVGSLSKN